MRRLLPLVFVISLGLAGRVAAQPSVLLGVGLTSPIGSLADAADGGYHGSLAVQVSIPTLPVGVRLDGAYHSMGEAGIAFAPTKILSGGLNVVFDLPGVGLVPYMLGGVGRFRVETGPAGAAIRQYEQGFQVGFGVNLGSLAYGAFAEIRLVSVNGATEDYRFVPLTVGLRL